MLLGRFKKIYWTCQVLGWGLIVFLNLLFIIISDKPQHYTKIFIFSTLFFWGILFTHIERNFIIRYDILNKKLVQQLGFITLSSLSIGFTINLIIYTLLWLHEHRWEKWIVLIANTFNISSMIFVWNVFYFSFHFLRNYKLKEIQNLRLETINREQALNQLKTQLNPHFIFNSLNSIRALVLENPEAARHAITTLSNLIRKFLNVHELKEVSLEEELELVKQYLEMEKIRFEDRLEVEYFIGENTLALQIPPLTLQALVENAIKHGISKNPGKGKITIHSQFIQGKFELCVFNTGRIVINGDSTHIGLTNTRRRLQIMYGENARLTLDEPEFNLVRSCVEIPVTSKPKYQKL
ncbi:MAG: histidine kinase [Bacteroidia bacterium]|nr:histidine kinase [Bacteroidia bacterium]